MMSMPYSAATATIAAMSGGSVIAEIVYTANDATRCQGNSPQHGEA